MLASSLADLDGLSLIGGWEAYQEYHHVFGHNLLFALALAAALTVFSTQRVRAFWAYLLLTHLHLLMDYYGSGPLWKIYYWWPVSRDGWMKENAWEFYSWQNISAAAAMVVWTIWIAVKRGRTPLEAIMPNLDRQLVESLRARLVGIISAPAPTVARGASGRPAGPS